jgi:glycosyltransferase involved in cell wall biosynthesis
MKTIAVITALNEEKTISGLVKTLFTYCDAAIVINDSTDNTQELAKAAGAIVYSYPNPRGIGISVMDGWKKALELDADRVI